MTGIVIDYLRKEGLELKEESFFAHELNHIDELERRELLRSYLCESACFLLHGIIDQVHALDTMLNAYGPSVAAVGPYVLARSILEYAFRLTYLTDPHTEERIQRSLKCYYKDLQEFRKLPSDLSSLGGKELAETRAELVSKWYADLTGGLEKINPVTALEIFEAVGEEDFEEGEVQNWIKDGRGNMVPLAYSKGYRIYSAVSHGNLWAIKHYGFTKIGKEGDSTIALPGLDATGVYPLQELAGGLLMSSLGFAVQFMRGYPPANTMNKLGSLIEMIRKARSNEPDSSSLNIQDST